MAAPPMAAPPMAAPLASVPRPAAKAPSFLPLIIVLGVVFLLAVIVILFVALRAPK